VTSITYSADGSVVYLATWAEERYTLKAIDATAGRLLSTWSADTELEMVGPAAVLVSG
jgi:hypothetical protein